MKNLLDRILAVLHRIFGDSLTEAGVWELLSRHKCDGLLREIPCPESFRREYALQKTLNANNIRMRYQTCAAFFRSLEEHGIPYAVHKGAVLSLALYGDETVRRSGDIDLLISRQDADRVKRLLCAEGFVQGRITGRGIVPFTRYEILYHAVNTHQLAPFVKETGNPLCPYVNVDVNTDLFWGESAEQIDMGDILTDLPTVPVCGVPVRKLSAEKEFIALCLHHYKDMHSLYLLSENGLKLGLFCDLYGYLYKVRPDPALLSDACRRLSVAPYVASCIGDTLRVFGGDEPVSHVLRELGGESLPDTFGLAETEIHPWQHPLPQRIFMDVPSYLNEILSPEEKEKIQRNKTVMQ